MGIRAGIEAEAVTENNQSNSMAGNGGKRPGAGRPRKATTEAKRNWADAIMPDAEEREHWRKLLGDPRSKADAVRFLSEHKHGKAPQSVNLGGDPNNPLGFFVSFVNAGDQTTTKTS